jgi:hypothetical protein
VPASLPALETASPEPSVAPTPRVFTVAPTPSTAAGGASASAAAQPSPEPAVEAQRLESNPTSGPNGADVRVQGFGWMPGSTVSLDYRNQLGSTGSRASTTVDARGRFTTTIAAQDPANFPGRHLIRVSNGIDPTMDVTYDVSG